MSKQFQTAKEATSYIIEQGGFEKSGLTFERNEDGFLVRPLTEADALPGYRPYTAEEWEQVKNDLMRTHIDSLRPGEMII